MTLKREDVVSELRKALLLDLPRAPEFTDDEVLKATKGSFLEARVRLRLALRETVASVKQWLLGGK